MKALPLLLAFACLALPIQGRTKHAPLPTQIALAKTVYIDNQSGFAALGDKAYDEVTKWGRFKISATAKDADIVFLISARQYVSGYRTVSDGTAHGTVDDSGNVQVSSDSTSRTQAQTSGITYLTVIDPKSGAVLWANQKTWGGGFTWA